MKDEILPPDVNFGCPLCNEEIKISLEVLWGNDDFIICPKCKRTVKSADIHIEPELDPSKMSPERRGGIKY